MPNGAPIYNYPPHLYIADNKSFILKKSQLLFGLWWIYVIIQFLDHKATTIFAIYSTVLFLVLLKITALFTSPNFNFKLLFIGIAAIATTESVYCLAQFFGLFQSHNEQFTVTGSWTNPNVIAIFLALTVPVFLFLFRFKYKKIVVVAFFTVVIAILLLKCRAAIIGTVLSLIVFYSLEYNFISWATNVRNRTSVKALIAICLLIAIPISGGLYNAKKDSADGRKFIWKLSAQMFANKPLTGFGYGSFERDYNLFQANYIQNGKATIDELANAGPVIMPHNELLQNAVEGGIVGVILVISFFGSLLLSIKQRPNHNKVVVRENTVAKSSNYHLAYAGIVAFIGMSMVNSTMQIVPVMSLLIVYAAIICSNSPTLKLPLFFSFFERNKLFSIAIKTVKTAFSFYIIYLVIDIAIADSRNKKAQIISEKGNNAQAILIMNDLETYLKNDAGYWVNFGLLHYKNRDYTQAINCIKKAQKLTALPEVYVLAATSYEKLKLYPLAIKEYETAISLHPSKFLYRMFLLEIYVKTDDKQKAIGLAQEIIKMNPKIPSEKVNRYKSICRRLLVDYGILNTVKKQFQVKQVNQSSFFKKIQK